ncbi:MAG: hypothetical protein GY849_07840, partial [Deltaproteobacteria bacterium]|nr:hypothetical protein [Deltaproteobacteria bacterium]
MRFDIESITGSDQAGRLLIRLADTTATQFEVMRIKSNAESIFQGGMTINESGLDQDTRIEGYTDDYLLFIDASTDRVGIGVIDPVTKLEVNGVITATGGDSDDWNAAYGWGDHSVQGYLTNYIETDPVYSADPASGIASGDITNWNTAYGWGDHSTQGYLTSEVDGDTSNELQNLFATVTGDTGTTTADTQTDTLNIVGSGTVSTAISGDTLTITGSGGAGGNVKQLIQDFVVATGESVTAGDVVSFLNGEVRKG